MKPREVRRLVLFFPYHEGREEHKRIFEAALKVSSWSYLGASSNARKMAKCLLNNQHRIVSLSLSLFSQVSKQCTEDLF